MLFLWDFLGDFFHQGGAGDPRFTKNFVQFSHGNYLKVNNEQTPKSSKRGRLQGSV